MTAARWGRAAAAAGGERTVQWGSEAAEAGPKSWEAGAAVAAAAAAAAAPAGRGEPRLCCSPGADGGGLAPEGWRCGESGGGGGGGDVERAAGRSDGDPAAVGSRRSGPPPFARVRRCVGAASGSGFAGSGRWW